MCLDKLESFEPCKEGWKIFHVRSGKLYSIYSGKEIIIGKWLDEVNYRYKNFSGWIKLKRIFGIVDKIFCNYEREKYELGFHVFNERESAEDWKNRGRGVNEVVMKVVVKKPVATGYQSGHKITVCRKMMVLKGD